MTSGIDPEENFRIIKQAAHDAKANGAAMLFTPEMALLLDRNRKRADQAMSCDYATYPNKLNALAGNIGIDIAIGSMPVALSKGKLANRAHFFRANGEVGGTYDKIHMFDVELATGESWRESAAYEPGREVSVIDGTPLGRLGLTICYDLRFPDLFSVLGQRRCDAIAVPAAFTRPTGEAHWHVMLRARAIEASAFVFAAAQVGKHEDGRATYGHSLVIDPWGEVLLDMGGDVPGLGYCEVDLTRIAEVRSQVPSLANARKIPN